MSSTEAPQRLADVIPRLDKPWFRYGYLVKLNVLLIAGMLAQVVSGYDGSMMNGLQSLPSWEKYFDHPTGGRLGTLSVGINVGTLISTPFVSYICEYVGRRLTIIISCLLIILGSVLQGAAQNFSMFLGARIILGVGSSLGAVGAASLLAECSYPVHRPTLTSLLQASYSVGSFLAALVTWGPYQNMAESNWSWRLPSLLQGALPLLQLVLAILGPESPRWLVDKGKSEKAYKFFTKYHAGGDETSPLVHFQMAEVTATIEAEKIQKQSQWVEWFKTKAMLHRLFICCAFPAMQQLLGNAIISYYLHLVLNNIGITDAVTQLKINIGLTAFGTAAAALAASFVYKFPRKWMIYAGYLPMCLVYIVFTALSAVAIQRDFKDQSIGYGVVAMIYLFQGFYHVSSPVAITYTTEITPFSLRAKGQMLYQLTGNLAGLFNNYVNPIGMEAIGWKYYIVWDIWIAVQIVIVYFFFPETYGKSLEEIAEVFGDELVESRQAMEKVADAYNEKHQATTHVETV
ncbi:hypothetical protein TRICI_005662 [Trichomonascus ciferrii]|uniref:Major facilitator superfamily (MFS) profile domain-containing protein n=1 Tax=Trichomonascus ciferrii TaxID=44093 RepID=A0A642UQN4_9ASCO|nr:hypothetical protein TRICI_005662 [Trichomonascus ciferrii]